MTQIAVIVVGAVAEFAGWWRVSSGRAGVWQLMPVVLGAMGIAAVAARPPVVAGEAGAMRAVVIGLVSGLALYAGTRMFVWLAVRWPPFRADVVEQYGQARDVSLATSLVLSLVVMVPAEELFWRGLTQTRLADPFDPWVGALVAWLGYIVANTASRSLPIVAGAVVGGALWSGLAWWSGGVLAGLASHILWTGLMLTLPPGSGREAIEEGAAR
jgi:membrane protease YdiL (CAAX protease family)